MRVSYSVTMSVNEEQEKIIKGVGERLGVSGYTQIFRALLDYYIENEGKKTKKGKK